MSLTFQALSTESVRVIQAGGLDANGLVAETQVSDGGENSCRHCLKEILEGTEMLILADCPFPAPQPYAEIGSTFFCAEPCERLSKIDALPEVTQNREEFLIRGYTSDHQIQYDTGKIVCVNDVEKSAEEILTHNDVAYVYMRSASNN